MFSSILTNGVAGTMFAPSRLMDVERRKSQPVVQFSVCFQTQPQYQHMVRRIRTIIVNEQRQLMTLGFALLVFMMTLFAQRLQAQYVKPGVVSVVGDRHTIQTPRQKDLMSHQDRTIAVGDRAIAAVDRSIALAAPPPTRH